MTEDNLDKKTKCSKFVISKVKELQIELLAHSGGPLNQIFSIMGLLQLIKCHNDYGPQG